MRKSLTLFIAIFSIVLSTGCLNERDSDNPVSPSNPYTGHYWFFRFNFLYKLTCDDNYFYDVHSKILVDNNGIFTFYSDGVTVRGTLNDDGEVSGDYTAKNDQTGTFSGSCSSTTFCSGNVSPPCGGTFSMTKSE